ncbi:uncharacterized protein LOC142422838, partial [Tenrec ecaudatus]|uniref:uncharacterized protein LOC142422838 n=1 Tax=Tenrec ecaudatus TaxID=94439 RepID=UPI003F598A40
AHRAPSLHSTRPSRTPCGLQDKAPPPRGWLLSSGLATLCAPGSSACPPRPAVQGPPCSPAHAFGHADPRPGRPLSAGGHLGLKTPPRQHLQDGCPSPSRPSRPITAPLIQGLLPHTWAKPALLLSHLKGRACLPLPPPLHPHAHHIPVPALGRLDSVLVDGSRSPRKPIDSLRDSRSLSYSPAERRHPSPQPSPRDQQRSSSERASRRAQRGDSRSPNHKRRKETPSPHPVRHRSSRSP